jgi:NTE family protein
MIRISLAFLLAGVWAMAAAHKLSAQAASAQAPSKPSEATSPALIEKTPEVPLPSIAPGNRPVIGLALEGGGALGIAHIGVLQWFEEHHIPVDRLAGTSMGALVGSLYATGHTPAEMRALASSNAFQDVFTLQVPYVDASYRRKQDRRQTPSVLTVGLKHKVALRDSLLTDRGVDEFLTTHLSNYKDAKLDFNQMPIPFRCVATDLNDFQSLTISSGPLPQAVRASISIPGLFQPVQDSRGHYLADGGILNNLPTDVVRSQLHADLVIAVRLEDAPLSNADVSSLIGVLNRAFSAGIVHNVDQAVSRADLVILVPVASYSTTDYAKAGQLIREGYLAADGRKADLLHYALTDADWSAYVAARKARLLPAPGVLKEVRVMGGAIGAMDEVKRDFAPIEGKPIDPAAAIKALKPVQSNGDYSATYETFAAPPASPNTRGESKSIPDNGVPDTGVLVRLDPDQTGPPYLLVGPALAAETSNITRMAINMRFVDQNLGGFGSELRATARVGYMTDLSAEYYRQLTPHGFFVQPMTGLLREPVYLWANQKRIAERLQQNLDAGVEAGKTIGNFMQVSAEWRAEDTHWSLTTGSGGGPYIAGTAQTGLLHLNIDEETSGSVSPQGFRLSAAAGAMYHAVDSANAPLVQLSTAHTWLWKDSNIFGLTADVNSYLRANVAEPYRFTLGGPLRLSASSFDEYRGTDTYLTRAGYLRKIAALPAALGTGIYATLGYEAGEIWSPEAHAILRQDGTAGVLTVTPLGSFSVGGSIGDAGHRKLFITIGRLF